MTNLIDFFRIVSDETRLRILVLLSNNELCVCEICDILGESQPKVSRHLAKLRDIGLVEDKRQDQWVFYYVKFSDSVVSNTINSIIDCIHLYPTLQDDLHRFQAKVTSGNLCKRNNSERQ